MSFPLTFGDWISIIGSIIGITIFVFGIYTEKKILKILEGTASRKKWLLCFVLTIFFTGGYIFNIFAVLFLSADFMSIMVGFVYIFGAVFVFIVVIVSLKTYEIIFEELNKAKTGK